MRSLQQFWTVRRIGEGKVTLARLGPLRLWLARAEQEWGVATHFGEEDDLLDFAQVPEDVLPADLSWSYLVFESAPRDYLFEAIMPRDPVLLKLDCKIGIPAAESFTFHFVMPTGIGIGLLIDGQKQDLARVASAPVKMSWFGSPTRGIFCRSNPGGLTLMRDQLDPRPNEIVCSLEISNRSGKIIWPEAICLDLCPCGLLSGDTHLFATPVRVQIMDSKRDCVVEYLDETPESRENLLELRPPDVSKKSDLSGRILCGCHPSESI